jgi:hypothetical protein
MLCFLLKLVGCGAMWQVLDTSSMLSFIGEASQVGAGVDGSEACPVEVQRIGCRAPSGLQTGIPRGLGLSTGRSC